MRQLLKRKMISWAIELPTAQKHKHQQGVAARSHEGWLVSCGFV